MAPEKQRSFFKKWGAEEKCQKNNVFLVENRAQKGEARLWGLGGGRQKKIALEKQIRSLKKCGAEEKMQTKHVFLVENRAKKGGHFGA